MNRYKVISNAATFNGGTLQLTEQQFESRKHALSATKKAGEFRILGPVQFKRGEEIGYDGEVNKALLALVKPVEPTKESDGEDARRGKPGPKPHGTEKR